MGVYVGISWTEYHKLGEAHNDTGGPYEAQGAVLRYKGGTRGVKRMVEGMMQNILKEMSLDISSFN